MILSAVLGAAIGVAAWYLGMDAPHAAGLGAAVLALVACLSVLGEAASMVWRVDEPPLRPGSRRDVVQLGWSLGGRGGQVSGEGVRRLRLIAARALALRGIDPDDPAAAPRVAELLGPEASAILRRGAANGAKRPQVLALLDRLEALAPPSADPAVRPVDVAAPASRPATTASPPADRATPEDTRHAH
ncbi:hypothetical protein P5G50_13265 [Leifsonia sp. F6_8S_P_1B]|uniref:Uncharacterized protein n=1 Tax=Leifsonia williamsii TaxID=3035919 RepID=A0ABT8KEJ9_9MICO|nr:hypothetical protein [Leifsonia williamsii]MDN4615418.1 hypothetical protein [Leifsonia williamsii]